MIRKPFIIAIFSLILLAYPSMAVEPDPVDPLSLVAGVLDNAVKEWEFSLRGDQWKPYRTGDAIAAESFQLKARIAIPEIALGTRVAGTPVNLALTLWASGRVSAGVQVNGHSPSPIVVDGGSGTARETGSTLRLETEPGSTHWEILIRVRNHGFNPPRKEPWPPRKRPLAEEGAAFRLQSAQLQFPAAGDTEKTLRNWYTSLSTASKLIHPDLRRFTFTGKPYAIPDGRNIPPRRLRRLERDLKQALAAFDGDALVTGRTAQLLESIRDSLGHCGPLREYAREFRVHLIGNAHIDIAWLWRQRETVEVARNTFRTVLQNMSEYPELRYAQSQALTYQWIEERDPELFKAISAAIRAGRWEVVGGMWVEPDCNLISGESWVRQILYGKRYFQQRFGVDVTTGWNVDSFGYNWNMPQFFQKSGFRNFVTQKIWWNDTTVFPYYVFWWEGVDGSQLLSYFPPAGYTSRVRLERVVDQIARYQATTGHQNSLILYGIGDHGGGPNREILDRVREYAGLSIAPRFIHSTASPFLDHLPGELKGRIPTWKDELYLEYHRGTYTTQAAVKRANRELESRLVAAEKWASCVHLAGGEYPAAKLERAWKKVLTNQFHDILPGSSITAVYRDAMETYAKARESLDRIDRASLEHIIHRIRTTGTRGLPLLVFNSLAWNRDDVVKVSVPPDSPRTPALLNHLGEPVPVEVKYDAWGNAEELIFIARNVPGLGYRLYTMIPDSKGEPGTIAEAPAPGLMENRFIRAQVEGKSGHIISLVHKPSGREFVPANRAMNVLEIHEDRPEDWDAWNIGYTGRRWTLDTADTIEPVRRTPVRRVIRIHKSFLGLSKARRGPTDEFPSSFFSQEISLWDGFDRLDVETRADWWEDHLMLKAVFPVALKTESASFEIPYAAITRTTKRDSLKEKARFEVPALRWVDLSASGAGVSLLNNGKYGHDVHDNTIRISLLRSPTWPDPLADRGRHTFLYSLYPHAGSWEDSDTVRRGRELNSPLVAVFTTPHPGDLPPVHGFFQVERTPVILETIKRAEDDDALILRLFNSSKNSTRTSLIFPSRPVKVVDANLLETPQRALNGFGPKLPLELGPFEIRTLKVYFETPSPTPEGEDPGN